MKSAYAMKLCLHGCGKHGNESTEALLFVHRDVQGRSGTSLNGMSKDSEPENHNQAKVLSR